MERKDLLDATGFDIDDIEDLVAALDAVTETEAESFQGDYTETADETQQRWENRNEGANREIVLLLPHEQYDEFMSEVQFLKECFKEESAAQPIFRAVTMTARQYRQTDD